MLIEILGNGCPKCRQLTKNAGEAVKAAAVEAQIVKVQDVKAIVSRGVMMTPALAIDGKVVAAGKILSPEEVRREIVNRS